MYPPPVLREAVVFLREVALALVVLCRGAGVQVEVELSVELREGFGGCGPLVVAAGK